MAYVLRRSAVAAISLTVTVAVGVGVAPQTAATASALVPGVVSTPTSSVSPTLATRTSKPTFKESAARYGTTSASVRNLQRQLIRKQTATPGLRRAGATGSYFTQTRASVKKFQRKIGYSKSRSDGIVDARSAKRLGLRWIVNSAPTPSTTLAVATLPTGTNGAALTAQQLKSVLQTAGFGEPSIRTAYGIAMRESRAYPRVVSPKNSNGTQDHGLFQINDVHRASTDFTQIYDPVFNAQVAYRLSNGGSNFGAWGIGTSGWAGTLKRTSPTYWQFLQDEMVRFRAQYPG